jgi:hypothetical protein
VICEFIAGCSDCGEKKLMVAVINCLQREVIEDEE